LDPDLPLPTRAHPTDAGLDLRARVEVRLAPGERALIPTGVAVAVPDGHVGLVHPRSGLAARHGVTVLNAPGTVDSGFRGEIMVNLVNLDPRAAFTVRRGDRIAQLLVQRVELVRLSVVPALPGSDRGEAGHGASGGFGTWGDGPGREDAILTGDAPATGAGTTGAQQRRDDDGPVPA
jgi:dUTP pyrophosphatase